MCVCVCVCVCVAVAISIQPADSEADPSDIEEDVEIHEEDDASSKTQQLDSVIDMKLLVKKMRYICSVSLCRWRGTE